MLDHSTGHSRHSNGHAMTTAKPAPTNGTAPAQPARGLNFSRTFSSPDVNPFDQIAWRKSTAEIKDGAGKVVFTQEVEAPESWSDQAVRVVSSKYFYGDATRGGNPSTGGRESSVAQLVHRVGDTIADWGHADGYFASQADADAFRDDLNWLLLNQMGSFNSPVWFNVGLSAKYGIKGAANGYRWDPKTGNIIRTEDIFANAQASACFLQSIRDDMESIGDLLKAEMLLFKGGSGTGTDLSPIRSSKEKLAGGGTPSGPVSFMKVYDAAAGVIKSGGRTRRSAKMQILRCDHPDIVEFVECKAKEEAKARALIAAGYDSSFNGEAYASIAFQNANLSVSATDEFMEKAGLPDGNARDRDFNLIGVTTGKTIETVDARELLDTISRATHGSGDPGMFFVDTINRWHTSPADGPITTSNPCFTGDTRILTERGWMRIDELVLRGYRGEAVSVFRKNGELSQPSQLLITGTNPILKVILSDGSILRTTPNHTWIMADGVRKEAKDLVSGDIVTSLSASVDWVGDDLIEAKVERLLGEGTPPVMPHRWTTELGEIVGHLVGDGCITEADNLNLIYGTNPDEREVLGDRHKNWLEALFGVHVGDCAVGNGCRHVRLTRRAVGRFFLALGVSKKGSAEKVVPHAIYSAPRTVVAAFLRGYFGADGTCGGKPESGECEVSATSVSAELLRGVQMLLRSFGIRSEIKLNKRRGVSSFDCYEQADCYRLRLNASDIHVFRSEIGFSVDYKNTRLDERLAARVNPKANNWETSVVAIEDDGEELTFNLTEPHDHAVWANGTYIAQCGEYLYVDDSACNLASMNLMKFREPDGTFAVSRYLAACRIFLVSQEILVDRATYPTEKIAYNSHRLRPLGLGYCGLGAIIMSSGYPYDSDEGRTLASLITSLMTAKAYRTSIEMAEARGPFEGYPANREPFLNVMKMHREANDGIEESSRWPDYFADLAYATRRIWSMVAEEGAVHGFRNGQVTLVAPTGTIAFMMDSGHSTGLEPGIALVQYKTLAGGGMLKIVNPDVVRALETLGYARGGSIDGIDQILAHIEKHDTIEDVVTEWHDGQPKVTEVSGLRPEHLPVFDCAFPAAKGTRSISWQGHIRMLAAIQPFIAGSSSKTVNMPKDATVEDISGAYLMAWRMGVKDVAIYRDGSKESQPVSTSKDAEAKPAAPIAAQPAAAPVLPLRSRLPDTRRAINHKLTVGGVEAYLTVGEFPDGQPGELFVKIAKEGSTLGGFLDAWATAVSIALQYGIPLDVLVAKFSGGRFEPSGMTRNPSEIPIASSMIDYIARWLGMRYIDGYRAANAPESYAAGLVGNGDDEAPDRSPTVVQVGKPVPAGPVAHGPLCPKCGCFTVPTGRCWACNSCGESVGGCG